MGTGSDLDKILKTELNLHAAWIPIANTFRVGDYGLVSNGVVVKGGNIKDDFGIDFKAAGGTKKLQVNFMSKGTTLIRSANGAQVPAFTNDGDIDAKLTINFSITNSFLLKAAELNSFEMQDLINVARKLAEKKRWKRAYRVVSAVYSASDCAIISSKSSNSSIELSGKANALRHFDMGAASVGIEVSKKQDIGLEIIGERGVLGLALFKLPMLLGDTPKILSEEEKGNLETSFDANWPQTLPDDV
ncbi:hypothetical protein [Reyranella sp.]|uniref:hypothetical protein n=1 Tax=Reyranella sp. TaxID=1929291 RepID=UPI003BA868E4